MNDENVDIRDTLLLRPPPTLQRTQLSLSPESCVHISRYLVSTQTALLSKYFRKPIQAEPLHCHVDCARAETEKVFGWPELIGGLSKVGGVVASLPHCRSSADTMYTRGHVEWSRQQLRGGGGRGVARAFADSTPVTRGGSTLL